MPVYNQNGTMQFVRLSIHLECILDLLNSHTDQYPGQDIPRLERQAIDLIMGRFDPVASAAFAKAVIEWGRGHRNLDRFLERNPKQDIANALMQAHKSLLNGDPAEAAERLLTLKHLGHSFSTKIVRFLDPMQAAILDSVIRNGLGYTANSSGYREFLQDCREVLKIAANYPHLKHLRICDIEAAIYIKVRGN